MIDFDEIEEAKYEPPAYGTPGWVLVEIVEVNEPGSIYRFTIEECAVDTENSTFWIQEGTGVEYWVDSHAPDDLTEGWWVFEGVVGHYYRGDGWMEDDDEEWYFDKVRPATQDEIDTLYVEPKK